MDRDKEYLDKHNKSLVENMMEKQLSKMCDKVGLRYHEWERNPDLLEAMKKSPKFKELEEELAPQFDDYYKIAEAFGIRDQLDPTFLLFKNLF